jgi:hypothetical protein
MSVFSVLSGAVQLTTAAVVGTDSFSNGMLTSSGGLSRASLSGGAQYSNGILRSSSGQVKYVDATAGLPANTQWANGLPIAADGSLCISTGAASTYSNGIPFAANGAVSAVITP